jgi:hypothetical protein
MANHDSRAEYKDALARLPRPGEDLTEFYKEQKGRIRKVFWDRGDRKKYYLKKIDELTVNFDVMHEIERKEWKAKKRPAKEWLKQNPLPEPQNEVACTPGMSPSSTIGVALIMIAR